jgi:N-terminal domain of oxidoreductase
VNPVPRSASAEPAHCSLSERRTKCGVAGPIESCDPTQRGWIAFDTYLPAVKIGEAVRSIGAGRIVASNNPDFAVGGIVSGPTGWQDYVAINPKGQLNKLPPGASLELAISVLALTGIAAYFGLLDVGLEAQEKPLSSPAQLARRVRSLGRSRRSKAAAL